MILQKEKSRAVKLRLERLEWLAKGHFPIMTQPVQRMTAATRPMRHAYPPTTFQSMNLHHCSFGITTMESSLLPFSIKGGKKMPRKREVVNPLVILSASEGSLEILPPPSAGSE